MTGHDTGAAAAPHIASGPNLAQVRAAGPGRGYGNMFGPLAAEDYYSANGLFAADGTIVAAARDQLHHRMRQLAHRIRKELPATDGQTAAGAGASAPIPSGYTYLLQFIAHDMVDSTQSVNVFDNQLEFAFANVRARALSLDTVYGPGPDEAPHAYRPTDHDDTRPRTRLRIGAPPDDAPAQGRCLRGDIGRAVNPDTALGAMKAAVGTALGPQDVANAQQPREARIDSIARGASNSWTTQPLVADPRNDAHALMSQTTVLFHRFHNAVMDIVDPPGSDTPTLEQTYRRFLCARTAVTLIYREIVLKDVLRRILYGPVYEHYIKDWKPLCDSGDAVPIEFSHGAFRFGHAMVREKYQVNNILSGPIELKDAMVQTSARKRGPSPLSGDWIVDWDRFFFQDGAGGTTGNISTRICPREGKAFQDAYESKNPGEDWIGLADRDLLGACYARLWSVPRLMARLRREDSAKLPPLDPQHLDFEGVWKPLIEDWLMMNNAGENFDMTQWPQIAADPPLPFFVLFEAKQLSNGLCLGPIGSIIIAETFRAAIARTSLAAPLDLSLAQRLKNCAAALLPDRPGILDSLAATPIETMPQLLDFLASQSAFANT